MGVFVTRGTKSFFLAPSSDTGKESLALTDCDHCEALRVMRARTERKRKRENRGFRGTTLLWLRPFSLSSLSHSFSFHLPPSLSHPRSKLLFSGGYTSTTDIIHDSFFHTLPLPPHHPSFSFTLLRSFRHSLRLLFNDYFRFLFIPFVRYPTFVFFLILQKKTHSTRSNNYHPLPCPTIFSCPVAVFLSSVTVCARLLLLN